MNSFQTHSMKQLLRKARDSSDLEGFHDLVTTEVWKTSMAIRDQAIKNAESITEQVSEAAKAWDLQENKANKKGLLDLEMTVERIGSQTSEGSTHEEANKAKHELNGRQLTGGWKSEYLGYEKC